MSKINTVPSSLFPFPFSLPSPDDFNAKFSGADRSSETFQLLWEQVKHWNFYFYVIDRWLIDALQWIDSLAILGAFTKGAAMPIAFILIYIIATVAFLPGSILTLGAGFVFGVVWGSIYVFFGATIGATLAFLVGRYVARGWVAKKIEGNSKFKAIDKAVGREGLKIVLLTRLSPIFPFNLLNYAYGITGVTLKDYVIASVGMIPGTVMYVYIGSLAGNLATIGTQTPSVNPVAQWSLRIIGFIATVAVTVYITKIAKKALEESVNSL